MLNIGSAVAYYVRARGAGRTGDDVMAASVHVSVCLYKNWKTADPKLLYFED